ncbi:MAG: AMP-binding protein [Rhodovibrio sp.]|nr:AMP-binding protein [Rhodovibrio sp.]
MAERNIYEQHLDKTAANYVPLTPISFLKRAAQVYPDHTAIRHGSWSYSWREAYDRCRRLASALSQRGIGLGDTVAVMAPNTPPMWEAHFGVPMAGAVLNALNVRLDAATIAYSLDHGEASGADHRTREFAPMIQRGPATRLGRAIAGGRHRRPRGRGPRRTPGRGWTTRPSWPAATRNSTGACPSDEWEAISLNYTSGTTGNPKGVVYHHRGAYLNARGQRRSPGSMGRHPVYLWTLPMFHCNGWCFPWTAGRDGGDARLPAPGARRSRSTTRSRSTASPTCAARRSSCRCC